MATQAQYDNALRNSGGDINSPMFQQWLSRFGGVTGSPAVPFGDVAANANAFMTNEAVAPYLANLPNYAGMVAQRSKNITSQLKGEVPIDVVSQIAQQAAERGISGGTPGGPNAGAAYLRALGLNSLQMMQQGQQGLSSAIADTPVPELFSPMSLYVPTTLAQQEQAAAQSGMAAQRAAQQQLEVGRSWAQPPQVTRRTIRRSGSSFGGF